MHVPEWYAELYELVDVPCHVEYSFVLGYKDKVVIVRAAFAKLGREMVASVNRLFHVVQADVTRYYDRAFCVKINVK